MWGDREIRERRRREGDGRYGVRIEGESALRSSATGGREPLLVLLEREGGWKREPGSPDKKAVPELPASFTRLLHIPITVSLIGNWSTLNFRTGSCSRNNTVYSISAGQLAIIVYAALQSKKFRRH